MCYCEDRDHLHVMARHSTCKSQTLRKLQRVILILSTGCVPASHNPQTLPELACSVSGYSWLMADAAVQLAPTTCNAAAASRQARVLLAPAGYKNQSWAKCMFALVSGRSRQQQPWQKADAAVQSTPGRCSNAAGYWQLQQYDWQMQLTCDPCKLHHSWLALPPPFQAEA